MTPVIHDGWLIVPYSGPDTDIIDIGASIQVGIPPTGRQWRPAFLDYHEGQRVAKTKMGFLLAASSFDVYTRSNGLTVKKAGRVNV